MKRLAVAVLLIAEIVFMAWALGGGLALAQAPPSPQTDPVMSERLNICSQIRSLLESDLAATRSALTAAQRRVEDLEKAAKPAEAPRPAEGKK